MQITPYNFRALHISSEDKLSDENSNIGVSEENFTAFGDSIGRGRKKKLQKFTEQDIKNAKENAYTSGFDDGKNAGIAEGKQEKFNLDEKLSIILSTLDGKLSNFFDLFNNTYAERSDGATKLAIHIAKKVAGDAFQSDNLSKIEEMVKKCMEFIFEEPEIIIIVNESSKEDLQERVSILAKEKGFEGKITIKGDSEMPQTDCKLEWGNGGAEINTQSIWENIEKAVS